MCNNHDQSGKGTPPQAQKGVMDLRGWDFERDGPVRLSGEYEFYWDILLSPEDFTLSDSEENLLEIVCQVANFSHRAGGIWAKVVLGSAEQQLHDQKLRMIFNFFPA